MVHAIQNGYQNVPPELSSEAKPPINQSIAVLRLKMALKSNLSSNLGRQAPPVHGELFDRLVFEFRPGIISSELTTSCWGSNTVQIWVRR